MNTDALIELGTHPSTPPGEATAAFSRLVANADARALLRTLLLRKPAKPAPCTTCEHAKPAPCTTCEHNRAVARRAVETMRSWEAELDRLRAQAAQAAGNGSPSPSATSGAAQRRTRRAGRASVPAVPLAQERAWCAECGAELQAGDLVRTYPGGRVYGTECHRRARRA